MTEELKFINSIEFFTYCRKLYSQLMENQYPNMEQSSGLYDMFIKSFDYLQSGKHFLKPNTNIYYGLNDVDCDIDNNDERLLFINDMKSSNDIFQFILQNSRGYTHESHGLHYRRVPVWEKFKNEWSNLNKKIK